jgi:2-polyprenyl-6-methoxyphenol hydroxylase-like FAD-dependent oxidoreductase
LTRKIQQSQYCTLRKGCRVTRLIAEEPPIIEYEDEDGAKCRLKGQWLIGADGKVGIVRKHFLEPAANIKQETGLYPYDGTWIAANLRITLSTPETHPSLPLWNLGYTPEEVYDLYWPTGWHFCSPPGKPTATGRIGPHEMRLWRHEFRQDAWDDSMDPHALMWEHITPMITRDRDAAGRGFGGPVPYPADCIEVLRCRPFRFTHKVVNQWFHKRTILIGDAAHVFPPFAGQGIASGVRDAHQLAWRLALLLSGSRPLSTASEQCILHAWAVERRKSVDDAAMFSILNGRVCNGQPSYWLLAMLWLKTAMDQVSSLQKWLDIQRIQERRGFTPVVGGFFVKDSGGGARLAQIPVQSSFSHVSLSDSLLHRPSSIFTLMVIATDTDDLRKLYEDAQAAIKGASLDPPVLSDDSIIIFDARSVRAASTVSRTMDDGWENENKVFTAVTGEKSATNETQETIFRSRLGRYTKFAILRPDFFVFAAAKDAVSLAKGLADLKERTSTA